MNAGEGGFGRGQAALSFSGAVQIGVQQLLGMVAAAVHRVHRDGQGGADEHRIALVFGSHLFGDALAEVVLQKLSLELFFQLLRLFVPGQEGHRFDVHQLGRHG